MVIKQTRYERAYHKARPVKRLVAPGWLVNAPRNRLKILNIEGKRPQVTVPADNIERMMPVDKTRNDTACLDVELEFT